MENRLDANAWFQCSRPRSVNLNGQIQWETAYLALGPEAETIKDSVVISLLVLEQKARLGKSDTVYPVGPANLVDRVV